MVGKTARLVGCLAVLAGAALARGMEPRDVPRQSAYVVPHYESRAAPPPGRRSATFVRVTGPKNGQTCDVHVEFRGDKTSCTLRHSLGPGETGVLCSRRVIHPFSSCSRACPADAEPQGGGVALVSGNCRDLEVGAQVVYTRGTGDLEFEGVTDLLVERSSGTRRGPR